MVGAGSVFLGISDLLIGVSQARHASAGRLTEGVARAGPREGADERLKRGEFSDEARW
jgi:hypothetical protein